MQAKDTDEDWGIPALLDQTILLAPARDAGGFPVLFKPSASGWSRGHLGQGKLQCETARGGELMTVGWELGPGGACRATWRFVQNGCRVAKP